MLTVLRSLVGSVRRLPAPPGARPAGRSDIALVAVAAVLAVVEVTLLRPDLPGRWLSLVGFLAWLPSLLVRRTRPAATALAFAAVMVVLSVVQRLGDVDPPGDLHTAVLALLIPYSLVRWASGADAVSGLALFLLVAGSSLVAQDLAAGDRLGGAAVLVAATMTGLALRARAMLHTRQLEDVRRLERERLARDLHDTVAHHLTAIAISAQAGLAVAETRPAAAREALRRIDEEATRTLAETRSVVRMLRTDDDPARRPLDDLTAMAAAAGPGPAVEVVVADDLDLSPTVAATVQRIAQESVANARRHATDVTSVRVQVARRLDLVELTVTDDGRSAMPADRGFGILGMTERAELVGGRLSAGPAVGGGWKVVALLPSRDRELDRRRP
ncbi:sensor histidine kinase [Nocardioides sp. zg-1308]|uniref:sensor histidine kinase n=1 Tax=Nocardioides sp. zg-1308 TaxID=2736253 RepID=UPI00155172C7|nr:sensor histidine kinase [Nocardioides sp. zg-1308]